MKKRISGLCQDTTVSVNQSIIELLKAIDPGTDHDENEGVLPLHS